MTPDKIAQIIGKSRSYVMDRLDILGYPPFLREAMDLGEITFSVAREFAKFGDEKQMRQSVYYAKRSGMTSEMARKWVKEWEDSKNNPYRPNSPSSDDPERPEVVVHETICVYCRLGLRLIEAEVVYMHTHCMKQANAVEIKQQTPEEA
jgi:hypothetical protein